MMATTHGTAVTRPERLDAYRLAVAFHRALPPVPRGSGLRDQLARASASVALNLAEGLGRASAGDRARFFEIAKASAMECAAVLDLLPDVPASCGGWCRRRTGCGFGSGGGRPRRLDYGKPARGLA